MGQFAVRNRADRCFQKIESNLNGFRSIRNPDDLAWEEYLCTDDEYGLALPNDGIGVPVNTIQVSSASEVGRQQVRKIGSAPVAMSIPRRIPISQHVHAPSLIRTRPAGKAM